MLQKLISDVGELKELSRNIEYQFQSSVTSEFKRRERLEVQPEDLLGIRLAVVVDTVDPLKQGRVRFYAPYLDENTTQREGLPWACPVSVFGGFDDSGSVWVPPAGSKVAIFFHNGDRNDAFYFGTVWERHRGPDGGHLEYWDNYPIDEYNCLWSGRRKGYLVGDNSGDQVLPPWNTEMYNGYDNDSIVDFYHDPKQYNSITYPHIKGIKTEEKHYLKFVDGDPRCNRRWKRLELCSSRGNFLMFKDDHLHPAGQWAFGGAPDPNDPISFCHEPADGGNIDKPLEFACCETDCSGDTKRCVIPCFSAECQPKICPDSDATHHSVQRDRTFANPFYKRKEEMRPYTGPNTPQANRCDLKQSGVHLQSLSGHQVVMDDEVNQPTGVPTWDREFDFGCDDTYRGSMFMRSATGHVLKLSDKEDVGIPKVRGQDNYIGMLTATGNFFEMNDHTLPDQPCQQKIAGERRGFTMMSTSTHLFQMNDHRLEQSSPTRMAGGQPHKADKSGFEGYCLLRSGYGLQLLMKDQDRQDKTANQFIQILSPQTDNTKRGPHMMVMQEQPEGPGLVLLRAGGVYYQGSYDDSIEVVGAEGENPASKFTSVTDNYLIDVKNIYFNHNDMTIFFAEKNIFMMAGRDCPPPPDGEQAAADSQSSQSQNIASAQANPGTTAGKSKEKEPCLYNVIVSKDPWVCPFTGYVHYGILEGANGAVLDSRSERVFASAKNPAGSDTSNDSSQQ